MNKLKFYDVSKDYLQFLKTYDNKVPNQDYKTNDKFFCGVVLNINNHKYFVPISSYTNSTATNFIIYNKNTPIASLRFSFMIPVPNEALIYKDFSTLSDSKYTKLLDTELKFCRNNETAIKKLALKVYKFGTTPTHPLNKVCCNFTKLETAAETYNTRILQMN